MAFLFVERLAENKSRFVQMLGKMLELLLLSIGVFSSVTVMKNAIDLRYCCEFLLSSFLNFIKCCCCFLEFMSSPLTIIIAINLMVLLIFASSAFHRPPAPADHTTNHHLIHDHLQIIISHHEPVPPPPETTPSSTAIIPIKNNTSTTATSTSTTLQSLFSNQDLTLTPPPSAPPLDQKWKDVYINEKEDEGTMDATWEAISGGVLKRNQKQKQKQKKTKHLNKSETWDAPPPPPHRLDSEEVVPSSPKWKELRKAETFNDAVSVTRRGGLIRRDPSMTSIQEFNHKVDNFIKNFNDNIRLQRQQSIINQKRCF